MRSEPNPSGGARPPAVAGAFYPRDPERLREEVARLLADVPRAGLERPKALVVPHAGYVYSGPVAASAYARLLAPGPRVERVVLLGPSHFAPVAGLALPEAGAFATPLGEVPVDREGAALALALPQVTRSEVAHRREHSLEVQLPFLQAVLGPFALVPLVVGHASPEDVAGVLRALWGGPETLVVISTDLSHYLPYDEARALDQLTAGRVLALDAGGIGEAQACGRAPLRGLLLEARRRGMGVELLDLRSSGDTAGGKDEVVGYAAFAMGEAGARVGSGAGSGSGSGSGSDAGSRDEPGRRARLITGLARAAIASLFGAPAPRRPAGEGWLEAARPCFVSLHRGGALRGCIGALEARGPLFDELMRCARAAAAEDPRFDPLTRDELAGLDVEVSVLSPLEPLPAGDEAEALARLRPGVDGLLLEAAGRRATFIPAMWEELPDPRDFLSCLRRKAGLPDRWLPGTRLWRFTADLYREAPP
jgi:AmmeMemoRadiSam system protein B/AmmeMemoRadiSam system protein A